MACVSTVLSAATSPPQLSKNFFSVPATFYPGLTAGILPVKQAQNKRVMLQAKNLKRTA
jgi:hypothetical protein